MGRRITIRGNSFERNWTDAQTGYGILMKVVDQGGTAAWSVLEDVRFEQNVVRDVENGFNILGSDYAAPSGRAPRITIKNNLLVTTGTAFQLGGEIGDLAIDHNTVDQGYSLMSVYKGTVWSAGAAAARPLMREAALTSAGFPLESGSTYTVNVAAAGTYDLDIRVASSGSGGTFHIEVDGVDQTGRLTVPNTRGWQTWVTIRKSGITLRAGSQVWRVVMDTNGTTGAVGNFNYFKVALSTPTTPYGARPSCCPERYKRRTSMMAAPGARMPTRLRETWAASIARPTSTLNPRAMQVPDTTSVGPLPASG